MGLTAEVDAEQEAVQRITTVARRTSCPVFGDILWPPCPDPFEIMADPGVMFVSARRIVVFQRIGGELRFYTGRWCLDESRIRFEQDRVWAEGWELGVFGSVADSLAFAEQYLVEERSFATIMIPRQLFGSRQPETPEVNPFLVLDSADA